MMKMGTVQKRADELKPGDVVVNFAGSASLVCPAICIRGLEMGVTKFFAGSGDHAAIFLGYATVVEVEAPDLTPAQQHAEELAGLVLVAHDTFVNWSSMNASAFQKARMEFEAAAKPIMDAIKPPEPPTLEEALSALDSIDPDHMPSSSLKVLDRARRAGVLK